MGGARGEKSFMTFVSDQNRVRDRINSRGGILSVEQINISDLEELGFYVAKTGENFVVLQRDSLYGTSVLKLIHGLKSVTLDLTFMDQSGEQIFRTKSDMRSSNNAMRELGDMLHDYLTNANGLDSLDRSKIIGHFGLGNSDS